MHCARTHARPLAGDSAPFARPHRPEKAPSWRPQNHDVPFSASAGAVEAQLAGREVVGAAVAVGFALGGKRIKANELSFTLWRGLAQKRAQVP